MVVFYGPHILATGEVKYVIELIGSIRPEAYSSSIPYTQFLLVRLYELRPLHITFTYEQASRYGMAY